MTGTGERIVDQCIHTTIRIGGGHLEDATSAWFTLGHGHIVEALLENGFVVVDLHASKEGKKERGNLKSRAKIIENHNFVDMFGSVRFDNKL